MLSVDFKSNDTDALESDVRIAAPEIPNGKLGLRSIHLAFDQFPVVDIL